MKEISEVDFWVEKNAQNVFVFARLSVHNKQNFVVKTAHKRYSVRGTYSFCQILSKLNLMVREFTLT